MIWSVVFAVVALQQASAQVGLPLGGAGLMGGMPLRGGMMPMPMGLPLMGNALGCTPDKPKCEADKDGKKKCETGKKCGTAIPQPQILPGGQVGGGLPLLGLGMRSMDYRTGMGWGRRVLGSGSYLDLRRDKYPVHGGFSPWGGYSACSAVCGGGFMTRRRYCNNPIPRNGGLPCMGVRVQTVRCNTHQCPVRGNWGPWSEYSQCSASSCGMRGFQRRTRNCNNPPAMFGGLTCRGPAFQDRICSFCPASNIGNSGMGGQCLDSDIVACSTWAKAGYCTSRLYFAFMSRRCCASCRVVLANAKAGGKDTGGVPPAPKPATGGAAAGGAAAGGAAKPAGGAAPAKPASDSIRAADVQEERQLKFKKEVYLKRIDEALMKSKSGTKKDEKKVEKEDN